VTRLGLSKAATSLLRALIARSGLPRDRILLMGWRSVDWQSLTFVGERHEIELRLAGPEAQGGKARLLAGLGEAEFEIAGQIVADISVSNTRQDPADGSILINLEALTIAE